MMRKELVVFLLNRNDLHINHQQRLMKVNIMNSFLASAAKSIRKALTLDAATTRHLEKTYVQVAMSSRFGGI
jgi:hypothetical protein